MLDEETQYIIDMGAEVRYETPVESLKGLLDEGYDAVFVGSGAPKGKELDIPGRWDDAARDQSTSASSGSAPCTSVTSSKIARAC